MSTDTNTISVCDIHQDDVAQAICFNHKKLLCLSCVLEKAKSPECSFTEIRKISGEKDSLLLECLLVRQIATKKKRLIEEHENKTNVIKDELKQEVIEMHDKLTKHLDEMKQNCLRTVDKQAKSIITVNNYSKERLVTCESTVNEHIAKLSCDSALDDTVDIKTKLEEIRSEILRNVPDKDTIPEGVFKPNDRLCEAILRPGTFLGSAFLSDPERYEQIDESISTHSECSQPVYTSSDEIVYDTEKKSQASAEHQSVESSAKRPEKHPDSVEEKNSTYVPEKSKTLSIEGKSKKRNVGFFSWFSTDKKKTYHSNWYEKTEDSDAKDNQGKTLTKESTSSEEQ